MWDTHGFPKCGGFAIGAKLKAPSVDPGDHAHPLDLEDTNKDPKKWCGPIQNHVFSGNMMGIKYQGNYGMPPESPWPEESKLTDDSSDGRQRKRSRLIRSEKESHAHLQHRHVPQEMEMSYNWDTAKSIQIHGTAGDKKRGWAKVREFTHSKNDMKMVG